MAQTGIPVGSALARKLFGVAVFSVTQRANTLLKNMTGPAPKEADAMAKIKGQSSPDMPVVRVTDLAKTQGDQVSMDLFNVIGGKVLVGDVNAEGKGEKLTWSSVNARIDLVTKVVDAGGKMAQQRTVRNLRGFAMSAITGYFPRFENQQTLCVLAGGRGDQTGMDWVIPQQFVTGTTTAADADFASIMVNPVQAPTYNRHYVVNGSGLTQGGQQLGSIASTDILKLGHIDALRALIDDMDFPLQPVKIADDPAADDEPMWLLLLGPRQYAALVQDTTANGNIRAFQQNAWNRASYGTKHPLFRGEVGMWNGILVKKMTRSIRFLTSSYCNIITSANALTATETQQQINGSLGANKAVERGLLLGAQAMANVYGRNQGSDFFASYNERLYNFERNYEAMGEMMNGKAKVRFGIPDGAGNTVPTDLGVLVVDSAISTV
jgi:N4-gp56 family major capsid protein